MDKLLLGFGLFLVIEGVLYAAFPNAIKQMMAMAQEMPERSLRTAGLVALALGVGLVWLVQG